MILVFPLLFGAVSAAVTQHRPVDLHQCSLVKFDLNDLDNALYMYKECTALSRILTDVERRIFLDTLRNKMDAACLRLVLGCGVGVSDWIRNKRSTKEDNGRKQKLYNIMNYLTDPTSESCAANQSLDTYMDSRVRLGLIHTIQERVDRVHDNLVRRCTAIKRSPSEGSTNGTVEEKNGHRSNTSNRARSGCSDEYVVGNVGMMIIATFTLSAVICLISLLLCKLCCLTDCTVAAIRFWTNRERKCPKKPKRSKRKKSRRAGCLSD